MAGPNFLGIGAPRCGTTWLYHQLRRHPQVWVPALKELHYFDTLETPRVLDRFYRIRLLSRTRKYALAVLRTDREMFANLPWDLHFFLGRRNPAWYQAVFRPGPEQIAGEITPAYATLDLPAVKSVQRVNPQLRVIFLMRDPIDRAWSAAVKTLGRSRGRPADRIPLQELYHFFESPDFQRRGNYLETLQTWQAIFPAPQIFVGFLEEIRDQPQEFLARLYRFLGISEELQSAPDAINREINTTTAHQAPIPHEIEVYLARQNLGQLSQLALSFGRYAPDWLERARRLL
jgi:hypothetical protein